MTERDRTIEPTDPTDDTAGHGLFRSDAEQDRDTIDDTEGRRASR